MPLFFSKIKYFLIILVFLLFGALSLHAKAENTDVNLQIYNPSDQPPPERIPSFLTIVSGNNQISRTRNLEPLVVRIYDQNNNPLPGVTIEFQFSDYPAGANGFSLSQIFATSDQNGNISIDAILGDKAGRYSIIARTGTLSVLFNETYNPPTVVPPIITPPIEPAKNPIPTQLIIVSGNNQTSNQTDLSDPLIVKILDQYGAPIVGARIDFFFSSYPPGATDYSLNPSFGLSDKDGKVQVYAILGSAVGTYKITASSNNLSVIFTETYQTTLGSRIANTIDNTAKSITSITNPVANSQIAQIINRPMAYTAIIWAILSPLLANAPIALPWLTYLINWLISFFAGGPKKKRWGLVYDSVSRKPVQGADVSLFDTRYNQLVEAQTTDSNGRFVMNVKPGSYYLMASRENYTFPSEYDLSGYRGKVISIGIDDNLIQVDIPIDPVGKSAFKRRYSFPQFSKILDSIYYPVMILGSLLAIAIAFNRPDVINFLVLGLYEILWVTEFIKLVRNKTFGVIYDAITRHPIDYTIVRIFNATNRRLLSTKITNLQGRYNLLLNPGHYILVASKEGYDTKTEELNIKKEHYLSENIFLRPVEKSIS